MSPSSLACCGCGSFLSVFPDTRRDQGVRGKTTHQLSTLNVDLSIPRGGWLCPGQPGSNGGGWELPTLWDWLDGSWKPRSRVRERDAQRRASPSAVPPSSSSSPRLRGPAPPSPEELSLRRASSVLSPLSLSLQQVWALGRRAAGAGLPHPRLFFLGGPPPSSWVCVPSAAFIPAQELISPQSSLRASLPLLLGPPPSRPAAWALRVGMV